MLLTNLSKVFQIANDKFQTSIINYLEKAKKVDNSIVVKQLPEHRKPLFPKPNSIDESDTSITKLKYYLMTSIPGSKEREFAIKEIFEVLTISDWTFLTKEHKKKLQSLLCEYEESVSSILSYIAEKRSTSEVLSSAAEILEIRKQ